MNEANLRLHVRDLVGGTEMERKLAEVITDVDRGEGPAKNTLAIDSAEEVEALRERLKDQPKLWALFVEKATRVPSDDTAVRHVDKLMQEVHAANSNASFPNGWVTSLVFQIESVKHPTGLFSFLGTARATRSQIEDMDVIPALLRGVKVYAAEENHQWAESRDTKGSFVGSESVGRPVAVFASPEQLGTWLEGEGASYRKHWGECNELTCQWKDPISGEAKGVTITRSDKD